MGTFYTPQALAAFVVRRTLAPLVADGGVPEEVASRPGFRPAARNASNLAAAVPLPPDGIGFRSAPIGTPPA